MSRGDSPALPMAYNALRVLRVLRVLNWLFGAAILALLFWSFTHEEWTFQALGVPPSDETRPLITGMRSIAALGLLSIPVNWAILGRLLRIVETVRRGDPFVAANALNLRDIAWLLLALQALSLIVGAVGRAVSTPAHPLHLDAGFSPSGWLAVILTFVLAQVFAEGSLMRDELEGTV